MKFTVLTIIAVMAAMLTGCANLKQDQLGHSVTLHGGFGKIGIPLPGGNALGVMGGVGYVQEIDFKNPTGSNVVAAPLGFVTHSRNKQTVNGISGATGTNSASGIIVEGSDDSVAIWGGAASVTDNTTNRSTVIDSK